MENPNFMPQFKAILAAAMKELADRSVQRIKDRLDTPYPPASEEGEAPHRRTGALQEGVTASEPVIKNGTIEIEITSTRNGSPLVPSELENELHRPYMSSEMLDLEAFGAIELAEILREKLAGA